MEGFFLKGKKNFKCLGGSSGVAFCPPLLGVEGYLLEQKWEQLVSSEIRNVSKMDSFIRAGWEPSAFPMGNGVSFTPVFAGWASVC